MLIFGGLNPGSMSIFSLLSCSSENAMRGFWDTTIQVFAIFIAKKSLLRPLSTNLFRKSTPPKKVAPIEKASFPPKKKKKSSVFRHPGPRKQQGVHPPCLSSNPNFAPRHGSDPFETEGNLASQATGSSPRRLVGWMLNFVPWDI